MFAYLIYLCCLQLLLTLPAAGTENDLLGISCMGSHYYNYSHSTVKD